jgi:phosphoglucosamine mutase
MSTKRLFGTDGIRGVANADVTPELLLRLGRALGGHVRDQSGASAPTVVVARDPRPSGDMLEAAFVAGLCSTGVQVASAGVLPTAAIAFLVRHYRAAAGAVITASHNHVDENGVKLFDAAGFKYSDRDEIAVERRTGLPDQGAARGAGRIRDAADGREAYIADLLAGVPHLGSLPVTVDCANGAAAFVAPEVYARAGARVTVVADERDGVNINNGVGATNLQHLKALAGGSGLAIAHDGDADRLVGLDEGGEAFDGADLLAVFAVAMREAGVLPHAALVTTLVTNSGLRPSMARHGIDVRYSEIGDRAVVRRMRDEGVTLGGEQYGHIIMLRRGTTGDGIASALRLMTLMARSGRPFADVRRVWSRTPQSLVNVRVSDRALLERDETIRSAVARERTEVEPRGRLVVRMSTIEPVVRVMCEAESQERADEVTGRLAAMVSRRDRAAAR